MMKKFTLWLSVLVLLSLTGCDAPEMSGKTVKKEYFTGGKIRTEFIMDDDTGQNGLRKTYGYDGKVTSTVKIHNGVKDGLETWFDSKGRLVRKIPYENGRINGILMELYPNGQTFATIPYTQGLRQGVAQSFSRDGTVYKKVVFKNNRIIN